MGGVPMFGNTDTGINKSLIRSTKERPVLKSTLLCAAGALTLTGIFAQTTLAAPIRVTVDGAPLGFSGTQPAEVGGSVLVPLRGVFEALHADVNYNSATRVINAQKGTTNVTLPLGSTTATVNGQTQTLSQPAQTVSGTTLVPLRFVAQAFGAFVQWHANTSTVEIKTQDPHLSSLPSPSAVLGTPVSGVVGQLTGVYSSTNPPQITLRVNGQNTSVPFNAQTTFLRASGGQPGVQVAPDQLKVGDQVSVQRGAGGLATLVTATYGEVRGTIKSIGKLGSGDSVMILNDGTTVELVPHVPVLMSGRNVTLSDIMPNETVVIRTNPGNNLGYSVAVATQDNPNPAPPNAPAPGGNTLNPAQAPLPPGASVVTVDSFTTDVTRPLKAGDVLHATLIGTPKGKASFAIPGITEDIKMQETSAGRYEGSYTAGKNVSVSGAAVLGKLAAFGAVSPLVQASGLVTVDTSSPKVLDFSPAKGATVDSREPLIYATLSDENGVGVDPASVRVRLDGTDVTNQATITPAFFNLKASNLSTGQHQVQVSVADRAGNVTSSDWSFSVADNSLVQSFTADTPSGTAVNVGQTIRFTLRAQPGGTAEVALGKVAPHVALREGATGVYTGEYTVVPGDSLVGAPVSAKFTKDGKTLITPLASAFTIDAGAPTQPVIVTPENDSLVGETLDVEGKAAPGATVRVSISYVSAALGGLFSVNGSAGSKDVVTDKNGNWKADAFTLKTNSLLASDRATVFTISAATVDASGTLSTPAKVVVRRG